MVEALFGTWVLDDSKSENTDALLEAQGVGWVKRKVINNLSVTLTISQSEPNKLFVKNVTSVRTKEMTFELGGDWIDVEEEMTELPAKRKAFIQDGKFVVVSKNENGETTVTRGVEGNVLHAHIVLVKPDGSKLTCNRYFNKA